MVTTGEGDGATSKALKREGVQEAEFRSRVLYYRLDKALIVSKEMGLAKKTTSRGAEGRLTSGPATP